MSDKRFGGSGPVERIYSRDRAKRDKVAKLHLHCFRERDDFVETCEIRQVQPIAGKLRKEKLKVLGTDAESRRDRGDVIGNRKIRDLQLCTTSVEPEDVNYGRIDRWIVEDAIVK